jgi:outer membrane lipopolysaccharide assembly protein LptE/RlpB
MGPIAKLLPPALALLLLLGLTACAHYQLGNGPPPKFTRLYLAPVVSDGLIPQAQAVVTTQLREVFLKDGRLALVESAAEADAVLTITLGSYQREATVSRPDDTGRARRFAVTLRASATLLDVRSGQKLFADRPLSATRGVFTDSGQIQAEYQTLPLLAEVLAGNALHAVLDIW